MKAPEIVVQLVHIEGPMKGEIHEFSGPKITIGRHPSCMEKFPKDLAIVSRRHAEIIREGNRFKLVDTSTNGTFLNGRLVKGEAYLRDGDVLIFAEGGPKVSFLTRVMDESEELPPVPDTQREKSDSPVSAPSVTPESEEEMVKPEQWDRREKVDLHSYSQSPAPVPGSKDEPPPIPEGPKKKVKAPFVIQCGPTIRSYRELPLILGKAPGSDFLLDRPGIFDRHAEFYFQDGQYWIRDLTGEGVISLDGTPVNDEAPLVMGGILRLGPAGPAFKFLGEGRLAEVEEESKDDRPESVDSTGESREEDIEKKDKGGIMSLLDKLISH